MKQLIIGFGNKARHGKDTAGEAIVEYYARKRQAQIDRGLKPAAPVVKIYKWADALYAEVNDFLKSPDGVRWRKGEKGIVIDHENFTTYDITIPDWVEPTFGASVEPKAPLGKHAKLLQWWGTEYRRKHFGYDYWVKKTLDQIKKENPDIALITDTRFINEADAVKILGGYTVNVSRLNADGSPYRSPDRDPEHQSETELDSYPWDFKLVIGNGHAALTGELAIALTEYLRALHS